MLPGTTNTSNPYLRQAPNPSTLWDIRGTHGGVAEFLDDVLDQLARGDEDNQDAGGIRRRLDNDGDKGAVTTDRLFVGHTIVIVSLVHYFVILGDIR